MSELHPTTPGKPNKPNKPYPEFPLFPHATGRWAKKIRGRLHYFGPWDDPDAALKKYLEQKEALHAGRKPRTDAGAVSVKDAVNAFLNAKRARVESGELSPRTFIWYKLAADEVIAGMGKARLVADLDPEDFARLRDRMARKWGPHQLGTVIQYIRSIFKHVFDSGLIDRPVRVGPGFKRPSAKTMRLHRAAQGPKLFTADEIRRMIGAAGTTVKAMLLLGINCGFGNTDCATLPLSAVDLEAGIIDYPRPKTGIARRCLLWPVTVQVIREALAQRPEPAGPTDAALVFLTKHGRAWVKNISDRCIRAESVKDITGRRISQDTAALLRKLHINGRKGIGFYTLRHTFRTIADEARDQPAADYIMGHEVPHMSSIYRERISDDRLRAVAEHVRRWLFTEEPKTDAEASGEEQ
jgi:integrase